MATHSIANRAGDTSLLIEHISKLNVGDIITWEQLRQLVGWDVQHTRNSIMATVKNRLVRDHNMVISSVSGTGYKVLSDAEVVEGELDSDRRRRRRHARRSLLKAETVNMAELTEAQRLRCLGEVTAANIAMRSSDTKAVKRLETSLDGATKPLALNLALEAIKKNIG